MLTRRRFLGTGGVGMLTVATGCQHPHPRSSTGPDDELLGGLQRKAGLIDWKHRVLGYPINMNTPSPEFFAWRKELGNAGIDVFAFNNVGNPFAGSPIPF